MLDIIHAAGLSDPRRTWWHSTVREDWSAAVAGGSAPWTVHVGTKQAALARTATLAYRSVLAGHGVDAWPFFLWRVRLAETPMNTELHQDFPGWSHDAYPPGATIAYLNTVEAPGSVSVQVLSNRVIPVSVERLVLTGQVGEYPREKYVYHPAETRAHL